ncbi:hypothetical protein BT93_K1331 [Corymbia citriodora subsp. variegata]|nr:hypothetical protein BT93_K1331 [Corymbia citriodora subsp. variegata]
MFGHRCNPPDVSSGNSELVAGPVSNSPKVPVIPSTMENETAASIPVPLSINYSASSPAAASLSVPLPPATVGLRLSAAPTSLPATPGPSSTVPSFCPRPTAWKSPDIQQPPFRLPTSSGIS